MISSVPPQGTGRPLASFLPSPRGERIARQKGEGSANDVLANLGVIAAGALVAWTGSRFPDLAIGSVIAGIILARAVRLLRLR